MTAARPDNTGRPLPTPPGRETKNEKKVELTPQKPEGLASLVPKESSQSSPERPRLPRSPQESPGAGEFEVTRSPENQTFSTEKPLPPINPPISLSNFQRSLTTSDNKPQLQPTYLLSPRTIRPLTEESIVQYEQELEDLDAELDKFAGVFAAEVKTLERPTKIKSESNTPSKQPKRSEKPTASLDDSIGTRETPAQNQAERNSPYRKPARPRLQRTSHVGQLSVAYRGQWRNVTLQAPIQNDPSDAGSESEN